MGAWSGTDERNYWPRRRTFAGLAAINRKVIERAEAKDSSRRVVLDMDSTESPVHGQQEGSAYNGHFESVCYHPLLLFNQLGDCLAAKLRPGNVHSAEDWDELLLPEIERQQAAGKQVVFRGDAAFAKAEIYECGFRGKPIGIPGRCRSRFRDEADQRSDAMPITNRAFSES